MKFDIVDQNSNTWNLDSFKIGHIEFEIGTLEMQNCGNLHIWNLTFWNIEKLKSRRRAPGNDEDPRKTFFKILDLNFIPIKEHDIEIS